MELVYDHKYYLASIPLAILYCHLKTLNVLWTKFLWTGTPQWIFLRIFLCIYLVLCAHNLCNIHDHKKSSRIIVVVIVTYIEKICITSQKSGLPNTGITDVVGWRKINKGWWFTDVGPERPTHPRTGIRKKLFFPFACRTICIQILKTENTL